MFELEHKYIHLILKNLNIYLLGILKKLLITHYGYSSLSHNMAIILSCVDIGYSRKGVSINKIYWAGSCFRCFRTLPQNQWSRGKNNCVGSARSEKCNRIVEKQRANQLALELAMNSKARYWAIARAACAARQAKIAKFNAQKNAQTATKAANAATVLFVLKLAQCGILYNNQFFFRYLLSFI